MDDGKIMLQLLYGFLLALLIAFLAYRAHSLNPTGAIAATVVGTVIFGVGWLAGLFFYREERHQPLGVIVWISSALSSLLFLLAALFIVTTPI